MSFLKKLKNKLVGNNQELTQPVTQGKYQKLIDEFTLAESKGRNLFYDVALNDSESGKSILALDRAESINMILVCFKRFIETLELQRTTTTEKLRTLQQSDADNIGLYDRLSCEGGILKILLRRKLPFSPVQITELLTEMQFITKHGVYGLPVVPVIGTLERYVQDHELLNDQKEILKTLAAKLEERYPSPEVRKSILRISSLVSEPLDVAIKPGEAWGDQAINDLSELADTYPQRYEGFVKLIAHCQTASSSKPSKKWLATVTQLTASVGYENLVEMCIAWFSLLDKPRTIELTKKYDLEPDPNLILDENNADILKGLIWTLSLHENPEVARNLVKVALSTFRKVPGLGPRAVRVGNACIYSLSSMPGRSGLYQLAVLKVRIKYRSALNILNKSLTEAAKREGITVEELEEMGVPSYGLEQVGYGEENLGEFTAIVEAKSLKAVDLLWKNPNGKIQKSVPNYIKENYASELKELKGTIKDVKSMMAVQRDRVEQLFLKEKTWDYITWSDRYLNHPIVGMVARKLIWVFTKDSKKTLAIYSGGDYIGSDGGTLKDIESSESVQLWHPTTSDAAEIKIWRETLEAKEISQPFKQAHREVYLLTDAEKNTGVYSNRFASHLIKQHQFNALAAARGWKYSLQGAWDGGECIATLELERFNLWAEFWAYGIGEYGADTTEAGVFLYVSTDQVRFYKNRSSLDDTEGRNTGRGTLERLEDISALILSEVLRDVDLFVGVCSVGNDPEWSDGGPDGRYRDYWHSFSFGDLNASAKTRKEILEKLIPKLKIGSKCKFIDKFLVVEGARRIYKIHLGSGNILMEPNNQYLCIVPDGKKRGEEDKVFLPFEGDKVLSVILSKAVLLAADKKIKDSTINSQIDHYR